MKFPFMKPVVNEIADFDLPLEGVFHNCALVYIDKKYPGQAKNVIHAIRGLGWMGLIKIVAVFDKDIDLRDYSTVVWKLRNDVDPRRDIMVAERPLDHPAPCAYFGGRMGIDATRKTREERMGRDWPAEITMSDEVKRLVDARWNEYEF